MLFKNQLKPYQYYKNQNPEGFSSGSGGATCFQTIHFLLLYIRNLSFMISIFGESLGLHCIQFVYQFSQYLLQLHLGNILFAILYCGFIYNGYIVFISIIFHFSNPS
jgi:hypothetical protein